MQTIVSPDGNAHLIQMLASTYRGVHTPTTTWCGIRTTRAWMTEPTVAATCAACLRRHGLDVGRARDHR